MRVVAAVCAFFVLALPARAQQFPPPPIGDGPGAGTGQVAGEGQRPSLFEQEDGGGAGLQGWPFADLGDGAGPPEEPVTATDVLVLIAWGLGLLAAGRAVVTSAGRSIRDARSARRPVITPARPSAHRRPPAANTRRSELTFTSTARIRATPRRGLSR